MLLKIAAGKIGSPEPRAAARLALDAGWVIPQRRAQIIRAATIAHNTSRAAQIVGALDDSDPAVADAARKAVSRLRLDPEKIRSAAAAKKVHEFSTDAALTTMEKVHGEANRGGGLGWSWPK